VGEEGFLLLLYSASLPSSFSYVLKTPTQPTPLLLPTIVTKKAEGTSPMGSCTIATLPPHPFSMIEQG